MSAVCITLSVHCVVQSNCPEAIHRAKEPQMLIQQTVMVHTPGLTRRVTAHADRARSCLGLQLPLLPALRPLVIIPLTHKSEQRHPSSVCMKQQEVRGRHTGPDLLPLLSKQSELERAMPGHGPCAQPSAFHPHSSHHLPAFPMDPLLGLGLPGEGGRKQSWATLLP